MPETTAPTGTYTFQSVLVDSSVDYTIDQSSYTNMVTSTTGTITTASVTPTSTVAYGLTTYTFSFVIPHAIVQNGKIVVTFPTDVTMPSPAAAANSCAAISGIDSSLICFATSSVITISSGYSSSARAAGSTVSFSVGNIRSPVSLQTSSSFAIKTQSVDDYDIDIITSGITVTMASVTDVTSVEILPESLVNGATTNLEVKIVPSSPLKNGDILRMTFPSQLTAPTGTISCVGYNALATSLSCAKISTTPEIIQITMSFPSLSQVSANELLKFTIQQIKNPTTTEPSDTFGFLFTNSNGFNVNTYSGTTSKFEYI